MDRSAPSERLIRQRLRVLERHLPDAEKGSPEGLHQARVASRRVREALPLLPPSSRTRRVTRDVRRLTRALGPVRDLDVALQILDEMEAAGAAARPALGRVRQSVSRERQLLLPEMKRRLERCDLERLRKRTLAAAQAKAQDTKPVRLARARRRAAQRAERLRVAIAGASGIYVAERLHDIRLAVKKLRYALELVRELSGSRATARLRLLKQTQERLGRIRDLELLIARTRAVQGSQGAPSLKISAELDLFVRRLENECRQLHGQYMSSRHALLAICDEAANGAASKPAADAA